MFASLGFLAERFAKNQNKPLRIVTSVTFTTSDDIRGYVLTEETGPVRVTLKGVLRLGKLVKTVLDISQEVVNNTFSFPAFGLEGLPSSLSISELQLSYTLTASSQLSECSETIFFVPASASTVRPVTKQLSCNIPGLRQISPLCSRNGLQLKLEARSDGALVFRDDGTSKLTVVISCDDAEDHPGTIHADVEWSLKSISTVDDYVVRSTPVRARRRQVRWNKWISKGDSWLSEASIWVTVPRGQGLAPSFTTSSISHSHTLSVQLRLSTLAEQPKLSRIFNIEPAALVFDLPIAVVYPVEGSSSSAGNLPGYDSA